MPGTREKRLNIWTDFSLSVSKESWLIFLSLFPECFYQSSIIWKSPWQISCGCCNISRWVRNWTSGARLFFISCLFLFFLHAHPTSLPGLYPVLSFVCLLKGFAGQESDTFWQCPRIQNNAWILPKLQGCLGKEIGMDGKVSPGYLDSLRNNVGPSSKIPGKLTEFVRFLTRPISRFGNAREIAPVPSSTLQKR